MGVGHQSLSPEPRQCVAPYFDVTYQRHVTRHAHGRNQPCHGIPSWSPTSCFFFREPTSRDSEPCPAEYLKAVWLRSEWLGFRRHPPSPFPLTPPPPSRHRSTLRREITGANPHPPPPPSPQPLHSPPPCPPRLQVHETPARQTNYEAL